MLDVGFIHSVVVLLDAPVLFGGYCCKGGGGDGVLGLFKNLRGEGTLAV